MAPTIRCPAIFCSMDASCLRLLCRGNPRVRRFTRSTPMVAGWNHIAATMPVRDTQRDRLLRATSYSPSDLDWRDSPQHWPMKFQLLPRRGSTLETLPKLQMENGCLHGAPTRRAG